MSEQKQETAEALLAQKEELCSLICDARKYVEFWVKTNNLTAQKITSDFAAAQSDLMLDYSRFRRTVNTALNSKHVGEKDAHLAAALQRYVDGAYVIERQKTIEKLKCTKPDLSPLVAWVEAICGTVNEVDVAVIAHWCWMVKTKAENKNTVYEIMPVLFGPQGSGKTTAINHLIAPLKNFQLDLQLDKIGDERYSDGLSKNLIVFFDELSGANKTEMNCLKRIISTHTISYRKMYSHSVSSVKQACSFIGCTNRNTFEVLWDPTGARRFWEIQTLPKVAWEKINEIDYEALWKGIDENLLEGYMTENVVTAMNKVQTQNTIEDAVSSFIATFGMTGAGEKAEVDLTSMYRHFDHFCRNAGEKVISRNRLKNQLKARGFVVTFDVSTGLRKNFVKVPTKAAEVLSKPLAHLASVG